MNINQLIKQFIWWLKSTQQNDNKQRTTIKSQQDTKWRQPPLTSDQRIHSNRIIIQRLKTTKLSD